MRKTLRAAAVCAALAVAGLAAPAAYADLRKALRNGLVVRVAAPGPGKLAASAKRAGRKVASGKRRVNGGTATVKLKFTKRARKALRGAKRARLTVKVRFMPASGAAKVATAAVTLKR